MKKINQSYFNEEVYEIAFGDDAINKGYTKEEVLKKIRFYSDSQIELLEACKILRSCLEEAIALEEIEQRNGKRITLYYERWVKTSKNIFKAIQKAESEG